VQHPTFTGGHLLVCIADGELPIFAAMIGSMKPDDHREHWNRVREGAERLAARHTIDHHEVSSWQSRSHIEHQFGGAIAADSYIVAFSGPTEHLSEVIALLIALEVGLIDQDQALHIATISDNNLFSELYGHWISYRHSQDEE
jgi:uncharacterized membrane-anchored protein